MYQYIDCKVNAITFNIQTSACESKLSKMNMMEHLETLATSRESKENYVSDHFKTKYQTIQTIFLVICRRPPATLRDTPTPATVIIVEDKVNTFTDQIADTFQTHKIILIHKKFYLINYFIITKYASLIKKNPPD